MSGTAPPELGQVVRVRDRHWVVAEIVEGALPVDVLAASDAGPEHLVSLISIEDDGTTEDLRVIWEVEPGAAVLETVTLPEPRVGGFDDPEALAAFLDAVRWGAIASADSTSLQAPFRSGIQIEDFQLDPVVRALRMPRVNLLIADDVGLGKTIEAGLVIQELLLRHRARTVMIVCPASLCLKWQTEMMEKFGLDFRIINSAALRELRRTRGLNANPFVNFPRVIVSMDWLKRPRAMGLLRSALHPDPTTYPRRFDLLLIDEVHQCAPSGRGRYAVDSQRTTTIREIAPHFEHRLFLSATPHNGYTESFTALLELLDPQRFARGVEPKPQSLAHVLVRRLKSDIVNADGTPRFPVRTVVPIEVDHPEDEVAVHSDLNRYAELRRRSAAAGGSGGTADLVSLLLKKRLFSSPAAFASTLEIHRQTLEGAGAPTLTRADEMLERLEEDFEDEDAAERAEEDALAEAARATGRTDSEQLELLDRMSSWASLNRHRPDAKTRALLDWIESICCPERSGERRIWNEERVIVFTEYRTTQVYLQELFEASGLGGDRLALIHGSTDSDSRERVKAEFQHHPSLRPVRILLATDAASEGIDLQRHCHRLVHVEIPFSPTKLEQRNGRIDRHGQTAPEVLIHHFVGAGWRDATPAQWAGVASGTLEADLAFLSLIARKVETIRDDLGTAGPVLAAEVENAMLGRRANPDRTSTRVGDRAARALNRIERDLRERIAQLRSQLDSSIAELHLSPDNVERVTSTALALANQAPLRPKTLTSADSEVSVFEVPPLTRSWRATTTDLYDPITEHVRPITFDHAAAVDRSDVVLAHLNHRLVAHAVRTLRAEIWSSGADTRMSRVSARIGGPDLSDLGLVVHARLVVVGSGGRRLHEELVVVGGRIRSGRFARWNVGETLRALEAAGEQRADGRMEARIEATWPGIVDSVHEALLVRADERVESLRKKLGDAEAADVEAIRAVLTDLEREISEELDRVSGQQLGQLSMDFSDVERDQLERNIEALRRRVEEIPAEIERETRAIRERFAEPTPRVFPAALEFLVPPGGLP